MDTVSKRRRSEIMRNIHGKDTTPELAVRRYLHANGLRFRLHRPDLPGRPDLVFPLRQVCVFVHGCFWHGHKRCVDGTRRPRSNAAYWREKIDTNRARDQRSSKALKAKGWTVLVIWECETESLKRLEQLERQIRRA